jgi:hypothetical protein
LAKGGREFGDHLRERNDVKDPLTPTQKVNEFSVVVREDGPRVRKNETARREIGTE